MKSKNLFLFFFLLLFILLTESFSVNAIGIRSTQTNIKFPITYQPGYELIIPLEIVGYSNIADNVSISIEGDLGEKHALLQFFTITDVIQEEKNGEKITKFNVRLKLPESFQEPGMYYSFVRVTPIINNAEQGIVGIASLRKAFPIRVLLQEKAISAELKTGDVNINETVNFDIGVKSETYQDINSLYGIIEIFDVNNELKGEVITNHETLASDTAKTLKASWNTKGAPPSTYNVKASVIYDGNVLLLNNSFKIGDLSMEILNHTEKAYKNNINPFRIVIKSGWNGNINEVYAEVKVEGGKEFKTTNKNVKPWEETELEGFLDAQGLSLGKYNIEIYLNFGGKTITKKTFVYIEESPEVIKQREEQEKFKKTIIKTAIIGVSVIVFLLLVITFLTIRQIMHNSRLNLNHAGVKKNKNSIISNSKSNPKKRNSEKNDRNKNKPKHIRRKK